MLLRDPLLHLAWNKTPHTPLLTYSVEPITHFTLLDPTPLLSLRVQVHALSPVLQVLLMLLCYEYAQPLHGNFNLENSLHPPQVGTRWRRWLMLSFNQLMWVCLFVFCGGGSDSKM